MSSDDEMYLDDSDSEEQEKKDEFLTHDSLEEEMNETISEVQTVLQVKPGVCRILLHKYKWNKESLLERFYENPDTNDFLIDARVIPGQTKSDQHFPAVPAADAECDICCNVGELTGLACNHRACAECWRLYLSDKIMEGGQNEIECMASDCKLLIEDEKIMMYITKPAVITSYRRLLLNSYVEANKYLKWCPGVDCGKAVKVSSCESHLVVCSSGCQFCFTCGNGRHEPVDCRILKRWLRRCNEVKEGNPNGAGFLTDNETFSWIVSNTKDCPKCMTPIEKNGGCNVMTCRNKSCRQAFCWLCLGTFGYGAHKCNRPANDANAQNDRAQLHRFFFYYHRYSGHQQSLQLEKKLSDIVNTKMGQMEEMSMSWTEVQFLKKAVDVLSECRRTLMYTYVFAFYLKNDNNSTIFEANQNDLERATEQLSGFLERDLENENLVTLKQKVQDKSCYVEHRRKLLLDHCSEGTEQNFWVFNE